MAAVKVRDDLVAAAQTTEDRVRIMPMIIVPARLVYSSPLNARLAD